MKITNGWGDLLFPAKLSRNNFSLKIQRTSLKIYRSFFTEEKYFLKTKIMQIHEKKLLWSHFNTYYSKCTPIFLHIHFDFTAIYSNFNRMNLLNFIQFTPIFIESPLILLSIYSNCTPNILKFFSNPVPYYTKVTSILYKIHSNYTQNSLQSY